MPIDPEAITLSKQFEPILLFHKDEKFFPIDPKFYLERCAMWRSSPALDNKNDWGELPHSSFPRKPQLQKETIAPLKSEATNEKKWIGQTDSSGKSPFLVIVEPPPNEPPADDRFLQLTGWEPLILPPDEITASSENRHPTLDDNKYNVALIDGKPWYYVEYYNNQQLLTLAGQRTPHGINLFKVVNNAKLSAPKLLVYHYFYALHEEPLRGCEQAGEGALFGTFAGEWTSVALMIDSANQPLFIGVTSRNVGDPKSVVGEENRIGMDIAPWTEVNHVGNHPKIFVSLGTHGNFLTVGTHDLNPFTPGDIDISMGSCANIEKLDQVIPGGEEMTIPGRDSEAWVLLIKGIISLGALLFIPEQAFGSFGAYYTAIQPNRKPQDETGGPVFGLILKPAGVNVPEQSSALHVEEWQTKMPDPTDNPQYDYIVDRDTQLWWQPQYEKRGFAGRWGPRVTNDPKTRRSGMRCPPFALLFLERIGKK